MSNPNEIDIASLTEDFLNKTRDAGYTCAVASYNGDENSFKLSMPDHEGTAADFITHSHASLMRLHGVASEGIAKTMDEIFLIAADNDVTAAEKLKSAFVETIRAALSETELTESQEENQSNN